jgi:hypothetical protein
MDKAGSDISQSRRALASLIFLTIEMDLRIDFV